MYKAVYFNSIYEYYEGKHAMLVENAIRTVKRALYYILRTKKSGNWAKYLSKAVAQVNNNYNPAIGGLQPAVCNENLELGDLLIHDRLKVLGKKSAHLLTVEEQEKLKIDSEKNPALKDYMINKTVLLDLPTDGGRSFEKETSGRDFIKES